MSEYQYYEFHAIDRPLTPEEMAELRAISTRARITPTSFVNSYDWGNLKAEPRALVRKYFDVHLYFANWGTRRVIFRLPRRAVDEKELSKFATKYAVTVERAGHHLILDLSIRPDEPDDVWESGEGRLGSILPLRAAILEGDLRCLYLAWLLGVQCGEVRESACEPIAPSGLGSLTATLEAFAAFMLVDRDLIAAAAETDADEQRPSPNELADWIKSRPVATKDEWLVRVATGGESHLRSVLLREFRKERSTGSVAAPRTVKELRDAAERHRRRREEREEAERRRQEAERAAERERQLAELAGRAEETWQEIERRVGLTKPEEYERAVSLLLDLREVAGRKGTVEEFRDRVQSFRKRHARKWHLQKGMAAAGLIEPS